MEAMKSHIYGQNVYTNDWYYYRIIEQDTKAARPTGVNDKKSSEEVRI